MKHGKRNTRLYNIWANMKSRCYNSNNKAYKNYGLRGISICNEWKNNFIAFYDWAIANGYKEDLTIDRIDNDGNYEPNNCRWSTYKEQANNTRTNRMIKYKNNLYTVSELSKILGLKEDCLLYRLNNNWKESELNLKADLNNKNIRRKEA